MPIAAPPPTPVEGSKKDISAAASSHATGQSAPGNDGGVKDLGKKLKTAKELEEERKKAEEDAKFQAKKTVQATKAPVVKPAKEKKRKEEEVLPEYVEEARPGEKKNLKELDDAYHKAYIPKVVESAWGDWWEKEGIFVPEFKDG